MPKIRIGVVGARSLVGRSLTPILLQSNFEIVAFSRESVVDDSSAEITWQKLDKSKDIAVAGDKAIRLWIFLTPIWALPEYFNTLKAYGAERIVVLSSTSRFSKKVSTDATEQKIAEQFATGEEALKVWAAEKGVKWTILRPTIIYGTSCDKNISEVVRFIRLLNFFPVFGKANGLRQPIHTDDVAQASFLALNSPQAINKSYNISGAEVLTYRQMVQRVFQILDRNPRILTVPLWFFKFAVKFLHLFPRYRTWTTAMAERMNYDLAFDHTEATQDFGFSPRPFQLLKSDFQETI